MNEPIENDQDLTEENVDKFLTGEIEPGSDLYEKLMNNMAEGEDSFVNRTLRKMSEEAIGNVDNVMETIWRNTMGADLPEETDED